MDIKLNREEWQRAKTALRNLERIVQAGEMGNAANMTVVRTAREALDLITGAFRNALPVKL